MDYITMLAKFGSAGAHPGGFAATKAQLENYPLPAQSNVLEVGCGTGQTACYLAAQGHRVTAVDFHENMVDKTRRRAEHLGLHLRTVRADVCQLPWDDNEFDIVLFESVLNFSNASQALAECFRVLRPGGMLYGRELMADERIPEEKAEAMKAFFGMPQILSQQAWQDLFRRLEPASAELLEYEPFAQAWRKSHDEDGSAFIDEGAFEDAALWRAAMQHDEILFDNSPYLFSGLFRITK